MFEAWLPQGYMRTESLYVNEGLFIFFRSSIFTNVQELLGLPTDYKCSDGSVYPIPLCDDNRENLHFLKCSHSLAST